MDERLKRFGFFIDCLIKKQSLPRKVVRDLFLEILKGDQTEIHQGAFLAAITAKSPLPHEIAGVWEAIYEFDTVKVSLKINERVLDNCGTGMDSIKTFNISTASAIIAAAAGVYLARHGARAITSKCGTVDLCEALGIDVECPVEKVKASIEQVGIGLFNGMSSQVHPGALFRILSQMNFGSILNIAASLANPVLPLYGVRGVYSKDMILPVIQTMSEIGYKRAMVFHGLLYGDKGIDEISPSGETLVAELLEDGRIITYSILPEQMGLKSRINIEEILGEDDPLKEVIRLLRLLSGQDKGILYDTVCLNCAPILYIAGKVNELKEGIEMAREIIDSGKALLCLKRWVEVQNQEKDRGETIFSSLLSRVT